jgi:alpha-L-rhamnosidase
LSTPYGTVACSWQRTAKGLQLVAEVPVGTTATVRIPATSTAVIRESGVTLDAADGVHSATVDGDAVAIDVGSGRYVFTAGARDD